MLDILIKDGLVVDGTGSPPFRGDVGISGDRIVEIGQIDRPARTVIDAAGLTVTPGFVDIHTHYDGQALWDAQLDPSFSCGVTTAVFGNCGVGFAPVRPADRARLIELMEGVEEIPGTALHDGLDWDWVSFEDYLDALERKPHCFDIGAMLPHGPLRLYVMGDKVGTDKCASGEELKEMVALVDSAMAAGAFGLSSSRTPVHRTLKGDMTPDFDVDEQELIALARPVAKHGGLMEFAPLGLVGEDFEGAKREMVIYEKIVEETGVDLHMQIIQCNQYPDFVFEQMAWAERLTREGKARVFGLTAGRAIGVLLSFYGVNPFMDRPTFIEISKLPRKERLAQFARPEIRARILAEPNMEGGFPAFALQNLNSIYDLGQDMEYEPEPHRRLDNLMQGADQPPVAFLYDLMLKTSDEPCLLLSLTNYARGDFGDMGRLFESPVMIPCLSDGGAHVLSVCDGAIYPFMIYHWARDRTRGPLLPLERVIHLITSHPAQAIGLNDRGVIAAGMKADINVFDFARLSCSRPRIFADLPSGNERLLQLGSGFRATIVSGVVTRENDVATGATPGRLLRRERALH